MKHEVILGTQEYSAMTANRRTTYVELHHGHRKNLITATTKL